MYEDSLTTTDTISMATLITIQGFVADMPANLPISQI